MLKEYNFKDITLDISSMAMDILFGSDKNLKTLDLSKYNIKKLAGMSISSKSLERIILPETLKKINDRYANGNVMTLDTVSLKCPNLVSVNIPSSVETIYEGNLFIKDTLMFKDDLKWENNSFSIDGWVMALRSGDVVIPETSYKLSTQVDYDVYVTSINFSKNIKIIPERFLYNTSSRLNSITFSDNSDLEEIGDFALVGSSELKEIRIPSKVKKLGNGAINAPSLEKLYINTLEQLCSIERNEDVFKSNENYDIYIGNTKTTVVTIPTSVAYLKDFAFHNSSITSVTILPSVTQIGNYAFLYCRSLSTINFVGTRSQWGKIKKGNFWSYGIPATYVQCTDGQVTI